MWPLECDPPIETNHYSQRVCPQKKLIPLSYVFRNTRRTPIHAHVCTVRNRNARVARNQKSESLPVCLKNIHIYICTWCVYDEDEDQIFISTHSKVIRNESKWFLFVCFFHCCTGIQSVVSNKLLTCNSLKCQSSPRGLRDEETTVTFQAKPAIASLLSRYVHFLICVWCRYFDQFSTL